MPTPLGAPLLGPSQASRSARRGRGRDRIASRLSLPLPLTLAVAASACGPAPAPAPEPHLTLSAPIVVAPPAPTAEASGPVARSASLPPPVAKAQCDIDRTALWGSYRRSQERPCADTTDCAVVITPSSFVRELATVVHKDDRARLEADARALLERCGPFSVYRPNNAIRVVSAACIDHRCTESETVMHVED